MKLNLIISCNYFSITLSSIIKVMVLQLLPSNTTSSFVWDNVNIDFLIHLEISCSRTTWLDLLHQPFGEGFDVLHWGLEAANVVRSLDAFCHGLVMVGYEHNWTFQGGGMSTRMMAHVEFESSEFASVQME